MLGIFFLQEDHHSKLDRNLLRFLVLKKKNFGDVKFEILISTDTLSKGARSPLYIFYKNYFRNEHFSI